jgi:hypothetical protein
MKNPTPNPNNLDERLKKIAAAQKEMTAMPASPEQILLEQALEIQAQNQKASTETKAALEDAKTAIPADVKADLKEHRELENNDRTASEQRIIAAAVAKLTPKFSNGDIIDRIDLWCSVITAVIVSGVCILIVILTHH